MAKHRGPSRLARDEDGVLVRLPPDRPLQPSTSETLPVLRQLPDLEEGIKTRQKRTSCPHAAFKV